MGICGNVCCVAAVVKNSVFLALECRSMLCVCVGDVMDTVLSCPRCPVVKCGVSRRYIDVCYCDMFSVVNVYLDHLKFCVVCINSRRYVCLSECKSSLMSGMSPPPALFNLSVRTAVKLCILLFSFALGVSLVS